MIGIRRLYPLLLCATLLMVGACTTLKPIDRAPEFTTAFTHNPIWTQIGERQPGNWQVVLNNGPNALDWRLKAIDAAQDSIDLQTFLWKTDITGTLILDHLLAASDRGVKIKILIDDSFLAGQDDFLLALAHHENIEYRIFNPYKRRSGGALVRGLLNLSEFHRLDHRMHNKSMIVDKQIAIVGGRNLADEYFGLDEEANFRDTELIVGGGVVDQLATSFDTYWNNQWSFPIDELSHVNTTQVSLKELSSTKRQFAHVHNEVSAAELQDAFLMLVEDAYQGEVRLIVDTPPEGDPAARGNAPVQLGRDLNELIQNAEDNVVMISAYLIPDTKLEQTIGLAVERGVAFDLLTNSIQSNNHLAAHSAYRNHINSLLGHGVGLFELRSRAEGRGRYILPPIQAKTLALHAKVLVIDHDKVFIGSPNMDQRSMRLNTEMGLLVVSEELNKAVREHYAYDFRIENAWKLELDDTGAVVWLSENEIRRSQPAASFMQRIEDWFLAHLPLEGEM